VARYKLTKHKFLSDEEYAHLEQILEKFKHKDPRNCTLLWLAMHTGARAQELLNLKPQDLDNKNLSVYVSGLKEGCDRDIPIPKWLFRRVMTEVQPASKFIFPITYNRFRQIWVEYRPAHKGLHCLRHTFAIRLYKRTKDIRLVQRALGHRWLTTTEIYMQFDYSQQELRKLIVGRN